VISTLVYYFVNLYPIQIVNIGYINKPSVLLLKYAASKFLQDFSEALQLHVEFFFT